MYSLMPGTLLYKLYQKRLLDKNAQITQEEILEVQKDLSEQCKFLQYKQETLQNEINMFERLIKKEDLYFSKS